MSLTPITGQCIAPLITLHHWDVSRELHFNEETFPATGT